MKPDQIKKIRQKSGLSQAKLAAVLGVSIHAVQKWEQGQRKPGGAAITLMRSMKKE